MAKDNKSKVVALDDETAELVRAEQARLAEQLGVQVSFTQTACSLIKRAAKESEAK